MRIKFNVIALLITIQPVQAKCHIYTIWHYKFPQRCNSSGYEYHYFRPEPVVVTIPKPIPMLIPGMEATWETTAPKELYDQIKVLKEHILLEQEMEKHNANESKDSRNIN
jgi:hypothetical protein